MPKGYWTAREVDAIFSLTRLRLAAVQAKTADEQRINEPTAYNDRALRRQRAFDDPEWFVREILGLTLYAEQLEIIQAVKDSTCVEGAPPQISVSGANGTGKDFTTGRAVIAWWLEVFDQAKVIVTAPTGRQVDQIVWQETRASFQSSLYPLRGKMLPKATRWDVSPETFALGFSTDKAYNILGFHSPHLLVIISEAHNMPEQHIINLRRLLPQCLLMTGNPLAEAGTFYDSHHERRDSYKTIAMTAWDSPNVKAGKLVVPGLVSADDIRILADAFGVAYENLEDLKELGKSSPAFDSTVNGNWNSSPDGLVRLAWIMDARADEALDPEGDVYAGIDVAGPGEDETVLVLRSGNQILEERAWPDPDPRGQLVEALNQYVKRDAVGKVVGGRLKLVNVDSAGIGYYLGLHLRDQGFPVRLVNVGEAPRDGNKFRNLKAELYWGLRMRFEAGHVRGLHGTTAQAQVASIRYKLNPAGQVEIERKEDLKKRIGKSPDRAEAIMLCYAWGDAGPSTDELMREVVGVDTQTGRPDIHELDRRADQESDSIYERQF